MKNNIEITPEVQKEIDDILSYNNMKYQLEWIIRPDEYEKYFSKGLDLTGKPSAHAVAMYYLIETKQIVKIKGYPCNYVRRKDYYFDDKTKSWVNKYNTKKKTVSTKSTKRNKCIKNNKMNDNNQSKLDVLMASLNRCRIISNGSLLYRELKDLSIPEYEELINKVQQTGYGLNYNLYEDCFVVY